MPKLLLTVLGTNDVRIPERVLVPVSKVSIVVVLPTVFLLTSWGEPDQLSFQLFQTVPRFKSITSLEASSVRTSYEPGMLITISGWTSVSNQSSNSGVSVTFPIKGIVSYGFKLTVVLAYGCSAYVIAV